MIEFVKAQEKYVHYATKGRRFGRKIENERKIDFFFKMSILKGNISVFCSKIDFFFFFQK